MFKAEGMPAVAAGLDPGGGQRIAVLVLLRLLSTIVNLTRTERPLAFFGSLGFALALAAFVLAIPIFATYLAEGVVPRVPTAILSTGLMLLASLFVVAGLILDTVTRGRREMKLLAYLAQRAPGQDHDRRRP
jgi:hypothetical protein